MDKKIINQLENSFFNFLEKIKSENLNETINLITQHETIYFLGVGKSKNIAKHNSDMLKSIGFKSFYLDPVDILHGDIGCISKNDLVILLSRSGNTSELKTTIPFLKNKTQNLLGIFCNPNGSLTKEIKYIILPDDNEIDKFNLMPTTSYMYFVIFFNIIVALITYQNNIQIEDYHQNHPAGNIGKKINTKLIDLLETLENISIVDYDKYVFDCIIDMTNKKKNSSIIIKDNKFYGFISGGDIRKFITEKGDIYHTKVKNICNENPFTININKNLKLLVKEILEKNCKFISGIPVIDDENNVIGLLDTKDIFNIFST